MIQPMIKPKISGMISTIRRWFISMDPVLNTYYEISSPITPSGNFSISGEFSTVSASTVTILSGDDVNTDTIVVDVNAAGMRFFAFVGSSLQTIITSSAVNDGKLHTFTATYTGTTAELILDGVSQGTETWALDGGQGFKYFGRRADGSNDFDGELANISINDIAAGEVTTFRIDQATLDYELSVESVFGSEEVSNGDFSSGTDDWAAESGATISVVSGELEVIGVGSTDRAVQTVTGLTVGQTYIISADINNVDATPTIIVWNAAVTIALATMSAAAEDNIFVATDTSVVLWLRVNVGTCNFDNVSVKSVTNAIVYNNAPTSIRERFTLVDAGVNWIGDDELWAGSLDATGTGWTDDGGGNYTCDGTQVGSSEIKIDDALTVGLLYRCSIIVNSYTAGEVTQDAGSDASTAYSANGSYTEDLTAATDEHMRFTADVDFDSSINAPSFRRLIGIA